MPENQNRLLLCHLVSAVYLTLKVENRAAKMPFKQFLENVSALPAFQSLERLLDPSGQSQGTLSWWKEDLYPTLEKEMLSNALRWKTDFVSPAQIVHLLTCGFKQQVNPILYGQQRLFSEISELEQVMKEAIYRCYVALLGK